MCNVGKHDFSKDNGRQSAICDLNPNLTDRNKSRKNPEQLVSASDLQLLVSNVGKHDFQPNGHWSAILDLLQLPM